MIRVACVACVALFAIVAADVVICPATAQPPSAPQVQPPRLTIRAGDEGSFSISGWADNDTPQVRWVSNGVPQQGIDLTWSQSVRNHRSAKVAVGKDVKPGTYELQVSRGRAWADVGVTLIVPDPKARPQKRAPARTITQADIDSARRAKKNIAPVRPVENAANPTIAADLDRLSAVKKFAEAQLEKQWPAVSDWFPRRYAGYGETLVIRGERLGNITAVKIGTNTLAFERRTDKEVRLTLPASAISGALTIHTSRAPLTQTLENYSLVEPWVGLAPELAVEEIIPVDDPSIPSDVLFPHVTTALRLRVTHVPGTEWKVAAVGGLGPNRDGAVPATGFAVRDGGVEFVVVGEAGHRGLLEIVLDCSGVDASGTMRNKSFWLLTELPYANVTDYQTHVIEKTWSKRSWFGFELTDAWGICTGTSDFGAGAVQVGLVEVDDDMAFRIASGPAGSKARWATPFIEVAGGWTVALEADESVSHPADQDAKARAFASFGGVTLPGMSFDLDQGTNWELNGYHIIYGQAIKVRMINDSKDDLSKHRFEPQHFSHSNPVFHHGGSGEPTRIDSGWDPQLEFVGPLFLWLNAKNTILNDHRVTVRIHRLILKGPKGVAIPADVLKPVELVPPITMVTGANGLPEYGLTKATSSNKQAVTEALRARGLNASTRPR